jgi:hypothetical protein
MMFIQRLVKISQLIENLLRDRCHGHTDMMISQALVPLLQGKSRPRCYIFIIYEGCSISKVPYPVTFVLIKHLVFSVGGSTW